MISSLNGKVVGSGHSHIELEVNGVGYQVFVPTGSLIDLKVGTGARVLTHLVVREDSMTLYGFVTAADREVFIALLQVTGVGPKLALSVVSALGSDGVRRAIASGDVDMLCEVPGIGKRSAQRILLDLREKMAAASDRPDPTSKLGEVREALVGLGYTPAELREVLDELSTASEDVPVEDLLKSALKELSKV